MLDKGDKIGDYTLVRFLGRGQFGVVWLAEKQISYSKRKVRHALKFLSSFGDEITQKSVQAEIDTWIEASGHPNVMSVLDMLVHGQHIVIASEFADGGSLLGWLKKSDGKAPSLEKGLEMMTGILNGIEHLHSRNVVHRDLKPDNILLQGTTPRITDFGISRIVSAGSMSAVAMGSPFYMSPESFDGNKSTQTDIWSAGVILYEMLTGGHPYSSDTMYGLVHAIRQQEPKPLPDDIPHDIRRVVDNALQKDLAKRYQNARDMRSAVEQEIYGLKRRSNEFPVGSEEGFRDGPGYIDSGAVTLVNVNSNMGAAFSSADDLEKKADPVPPQEKPAEIVTPQPEESPAAPEMETQTNRHIARALETVLQTSDETIAIRPPIDSQKKLMIIGGVAGAAALGFALFVVVMVVVSRAFLSGSSETVANANTVSTNAMSGKVIADSNTATTTATTGQTPAPPDGMVFVEGGEFMMGRNNGDPRERPEHRVTVQSFYMDIYEVTNVKYAEFIEATGRKHPAWKNSTYPAGQENFPVVGVNWDLASGYAKWKGKRLPTEGEWEFAARGTEGLLYPWGNDWDDRNANVGTKGFKAVGTSPGTSPFGVYDMIGNAWEWTSSDYRSYDPGSTVVAGKKTIRGGSFKADKGSRVATFRLGWKATGDTYDQTGIRCVKDVLR